MKNIIYSVINSYLVRMKGYAKLLPMLALCTLTVAEPAFAGLQKGNQSLNELKVWGYSILGILIFLYIMYHIVLAILNKGTWSDVAMSVVYSAIAGGAIALGDYAWSIWGS